MLKRIQSVGFLSKMVADVTKAMGSIPLNDPTTPSLSAGLEVPRMGALKYQVQGLSMEPESQNEVRSLNCHVSIGNCINALQPLMRKPLHNWAATPVLEVLPAAGSDMNAYYNRRSLKFFYYNHKGRNFYFGDSVDIITHELGHAVLDAMRPDFWSVQSLEIWSFHEAFSDIVAVFNLLSHNFAVEAVLKETGGNMRLSNHASRLAEQIGGLIRAVTMDSSYLTDALRNPAVEKFHYVDPSSLPKEAPNNKLAAECHSFGRVFSAAWYEAFVRCYEHELSVGSSPEVAVAKSRDACMSTILKAAAASPRVSNYYEAVARCMVSIAKDFSERHSLIFSEVFSEWNILKAGQASVLSSSAKSWSDVVVQLNRRDSAVKTKDGAFVSMRENVSMKASQLPSLSGLSLSSDIEFEVPFDTYYQFDSKGNLIGEMTPDRESVIRDANDCMAQVYGELKPDGMWDLIDGKVTRRFFN